MKKLIVVLLLLACLYACSPFDRPLDEQYNVLRPEFPGSPMADMEV